MAEEDKDSDRVSNPSPLLVVVFGGGGQNNHRKREAVPHSTTRRPDQRWNLIPYLWVLAVDGALIRITARLSDDQRTIFVDSAQLLQSAALDLPRRMVPKVFHKKDWTRLWMMPNLTAQCPCRGQVTLSQRGETMVLEFEGVGDMGEATSWSFGEAPKLRNTDRVWFIFRCPLCPLALRGRSKCKGCIAVDITKERNVGLAHTWSRRDPS